MRVVRMTRPEWSLIILGILFWISACISTIITIHYSKTIFEISFGYGPIVEEYFKTKTFADCSNPQCDYALKMPFLLWIISIFGVISESARNVALIKNIIFSIVTISISIYIYRKIRHFYPKILISWIAILILFVLSIPLAKHAGHIEYEESISIPIFYIIGLSSPLLLSQRLAANDRAKISLGTILGGAILYLTKPALILVFGWAVMVALWLAIKDRQRWLLIAVLLAALVPLLWGLHTYRTGGRFSYTTSMVGSDLLRAWNGDTAKIFPRGGVDRTLDSAEIRFSNGDYFRMIPKPGREKYVDEWAWSDGNQDIAWLWLADHPKEAGWLFARKLNNYLFSIQKTPEHYGGTPMPQSSMARLQDWTITSWLIYGRLSVALYQPAVKRTQIVDFQSVESLNLWWPVGGHGHGCSDRIAGRL